jgi:hypothetical protein
LPTLRRTLAAPVSGASVPGKRFPLDIAQNSAIVKDVDDVAPDQPPSTPDSAASLCACRSLSPSLSPSLNTAAAVYPAATLTFAAASYPIASALRHSPPGLAI